MNETLAGIVAKIKLYPAKGVFLAIYAGLTDKPALIDAFNRNTIRKTCQYLVDNLFISFDEDSKQYAILHQRMQVGASTDAKSASTDANSPPIHSCNSFIHDIGHSKNQQSDSDWDSEEISINPVSLKKTLGKYYENLPCAFKALFDNPPNIDSSLQPGSRIVSTTEIRAIKVHLPDHCWDGYEKWRKVVRDYFNEPALADFLVDRIVLMRWTLGISPFDNDCFLLRNWLEYCTRQKACADAEGRTDKFGKPMTKIPFLFECVKKQYEQCGVKWESEKDTDYNEFVNFGLSIKNTYKSLRRREMAGQDGTPMLFTDKVLEDASVRVTTGEEAAVDRRQAAGNSAVVCGLPSAVSPASADSRSEFEKRRDYEEKLQKDMKERFAKWQEESRHKHGMDKPPMAILEKILG